MQPRLRKSRYEVSESNFRNNVVIPFLKTLKDTYAMAIQQVSISGDPDFVLCCRGRFVSLELKAQDGIISPLQKYKLDAVLRAHGVSFVASPLNWREIKTKLIQLDEGESDDKVFGDQLSASQYD